MAKILDGKEVGQALKDRVRESAEQYREQGITPKLVVLRVGEDPASVAYENAAMKVMKSVSIDADNITLAEDSTTEDVIDAIEKIDFMVFERVCQFLHEWNKSGPNGTCPYPITISCNLSRIELNNPQLAKIYSQIASQYDIFPSKIEIELTESMTYGNKKQLLAQMNKIKDAGFSISVDDFGSGYSSLNLLKSIPADVIKLDKEFFAPDGVGGREQIIVKSIIDMAKKLNMVTVAEGVEDKEKSDLLKSLGCDICQGYYFARPMPENEYKDVLHKLLG